MRRLEGSGSFPGVIDPNPCEVSIEKQKETSSVDPIITLPTTSSGSRAPADVHSTVDPVSSSPRLLWVHPLLPLMVGLGIPISERVRVTL